MKNTINVGIALLLIVICSSFAFSAIIFGHSSERITTTIFGERTLQDALNKNLMTAPVYYKCPANQCIAGYSGIEPTCIEVLSYDKKGNPLAPVRKVKNPNIPSFTLPAEDGTEFLNPDFEFNIPVSTPGNTSTGIIGDIDPALLKMTTSVTASQSIVGASTVQCRLVNFDDPKCLINDINLNPLPSPSSPTVICSDIAARYIQNNCQAGLGTGLFAYTWETQNNGQLYVFDEATINANYTSSKALDTTLTVRVVAASGSTPGKCEISSYSDSICSMSYSSASPFVVESQFSSGSVADCRDLAINYISRVCQPKYQDGLYMFRTLTANSAKVVALASSVTMVEPRFPIGYDLDGNGKMDAFDIDGDGLLDIWDLDNDWDGDLSRVDDVINSGQQIDVVYAGIFEGYFDPDYGSSHSTDWAYGRMSTLDLDAFSSVQRIDTNSDGITDELELGLHTAVSDVRNINWVVSNLNASTATLHPDPERKINVTVRLVGSDLVRTRNMALP
jgi:hypothetical protein